MKQLPDPFEFGYIIDSESGLLVQQHLSQSVIPPELLIDSLCDCTDMCGKRQMSILVHKPVNAGQRLR